MKCPFRTITKTKHIDTTGENVTTVEFAPCLGNECPYYGIPVQKHSPSGGWSTFIEPKCRRCEAQN